MRTESIVLDCCVRSGSITGGSAVMLTSVATAPTAISVRSTTVSPMRTWTPSSILVLNPGASSRRR